MTRRCIGGGCRGCVSAKRQIGVCLHGMHLPGSSFFCVANWCWCNQLLACPPALRLNMHAFAPDTLYCYYTPEHPSWAHLGHTGGCDQVVHTSRQAHCPSWSHPAARRARWRISKGGCDTCTLSGQQCEQHRTQLLALSQSVPVPGLSGSGAAALRCIASASASCSTEAMMEGTLKLFWGCSLMCVFEALNTVHNKRQ